MATYLCTLPSKYTHDAIQEIITAPNPTYIDMVHFSPIVFGAGAFNTQYNKDPELGDIAEVLSHAFSKGINTIDTAALYGPSEIILGKALAKLGTNRQEYVLCTKCCRYETGEFEYSRKAVLNCFNRSLKRLGTDYVDVLYVHDVEFGSPENVLEAIRAAFELKDAGKAKWVGICGLPLPVLTKAAIYARKQLGRPIDVVLSYCNLTLQNQLLLEFESKLRDAGVKEILNASPLSMSLLRSQPTHDFHPASKKLRDTADEIGEWLASQGIEFADVATQFAFAKWPNSTVVGLRTVGEIDAALENRKTGLHNPDDKFWAEIQHRFGDHLNMIWEEEPAKRFADQWASLAD